MAERHDNYQAIVASMTRNLVAFGYEGLTEEHVLASYDKAMAGEQPEGIIVMVAQLAGRALARRIIETPLHGPMVFCCNGPSQDD